MIWLNAALLSLLVLGHTTLWIALVNRTHGRPWGHRTLKRIRHVHDVMLPLFPLVVLWFVGLRGPRLLRGGSWSDLGWGWTCVFIVCTGGVVWLLRQILWRKLSLPPESLLSTTGIVHDIAADLGHRPVTHGPYFVLAKVPGNEQFQLELNEKHFRLPGLPLELDGLSILHLSDFHFLGTLSQDYYIRSMELAARESVDMICFTGDLIDRPDLISWLPQTLGQLSAPLGRFFILGNHDWYQDAESIRAEVVSSGWIDLGSRAEVIHWKDRTLGLAGDETPWIGQHPVFPDDIDFRLLLSHCPDNMRWARRTQVDLMLSGHNHGGQVQLPVIGPVYSPSKYGCKYAGGVFWEDPTLLHVSRGLAGQHPLRWRCLPEISRLVLHPAKEHSSTSRS